jgi:oxygen-independent coproporphyrinogen-3 oxidase
VYLYNFYKKFDLGFTELLKLFYKDENIIIIENKDEYVDYSQDYIYINKIYNEKNTSVIIEYRKGKKIIYNDLIYIKDDFENLLYVRELKNKIKSSFYKMMVLEKNKKLSWGILTGIRPGIIVHKLMDKNLNKEKILEILDKKYHIIDKKANLIYDVAVNERDIILNTKTNEISLYIGIPFCPTRCKYCSFVSHILNDDKNILELYTNALIKELNSVLETIKSKNLIVKTLYFGGGTPSVLDVYMLESLFILIDKKIGLKNIDEITFEAGRSDTLNKEYLMYLKNIGVNRICLNPQTLNNNTLIEVGRNHTVEDFIDKFELMRNLNFKNINTDIILGLPCEGIEDVKNTFDILDKLKPDSITIHSLAVKRASKMKEEYNGNLFLDDKEGEKIFDYSILRVYKMGLLPYYLYRQKNSTANMENIGFSRLDNKCAYNVQMIEDNQNILGIGAGSSSKIIEKANNKIEKIYNLKNVFEYIKRIDEQICKKKDFINKYIN